MVDSAALLVFAPECSSSLLPTISEQIIKSKDYSVQQRETFNDECDRFVEPVIWLIEWTRSYAVRAIASVLNPEVVA